MDNRNENVQDRRVLGRAKSHMEGPPAKMAREAYGSRKSFSLNEAVMSLDVALGRLKKSKLVPGEGATSAGAMGRRSVISGSALNPSVAEPSLISMNLSHYELMRNLSRTTANSESAFSGTTCYNASLDSSHKNEHLEKYFRSVDMWQRNNARDPATAPPLHSPIPDN